MHPANWLRQSQRKTKWARISRTIEVESRRARLYCTRTEPRYATAPCSDARALAYFLLLLLFFAAASAAAFWPSFTPSAFAAAFISSSCLARIPPHAACLALCRTNYQNQRGTVTKRLQHVWHGCQVSGQVQRSDTVGSKCGGDDLWQGEHDMIRKQGEGGEGGATSSAASDARISAEAHDTHHLSDDTVGSG
jgi:hypothetical protein